MILYALPDIACPTIRMLGGSAAIRWNLDSESRHRFCIAGACRWSFLVGLRSNFMHKFDRIFDGSTNFLYTYFFLYIPILYIKN